MKNKTINKWYNSEFAQMIGFGLMIMLMCTGMGSCIGLASM